MEVQKFHLLAAQLWQMSESGFEYDLTLLERSVLKQGRVLRKSLVEMNKP